MKHNPYIPVKAPTIEVSSAVFRASLSDLADDILMALNDYTARTGMRVLSFAISFEKRIDHLPHSVDRPVYVYTVNPIVCRP